MAVLMNHRECTVEGCTRPIRCKMMCESHYAKSRRKPRPTTEQRYEAKVDRSGGPDACHPWTASTNEHGYGTFSNDGEWLAARWGYKHYVGPLAANEVVRHKCDNPPCQNRDHWIKGTQVENIHDAVSRNRQHRPAGSKNVKAKLTEADVIDIRSRVGMSGAAIAREYGVHQVTISAVLRRHTWKHVA